MKLLIIGVAGGSGGGKSTFCRTHSGRLRAQYTVLCQQGIKTLCFITL